MNNKTDIDVKYVSPLKRICMTIGELPASYLETMSYYEMLVWFTEFLKNQVIPTINNNAEAVSELQALYEELRTYVNDYFDNLDVQEEINNKLDEMAESGQLTDIIAQYLGLAGMIVFDSVADMKLAENLVNGSKCQTLGYSSVNDGGSALYKIRTVTNEDVIDEQYIIALNDVTLIAEIIVNDEVNILQLGCKNDGSADIGATVNKVINTKNQKCYVPLGEYLVTTTINPNGNKFLTIDGNLTYTGNDSCIKINSKNNYIKTEKITTTNGICVLLENNNSESSDCVNNKLFFNGVLASTNNHAMYLHAILRGIAYNEIHFDTLSAGTDKYSLYIKTESSGSGAKYINENVFYGGKCSKGLYGIYIDTNTSGSSGECNNLKFYNVALEGITNGIYVNNGRTNIFEFPRIAEISASNKIITIAGGADGNVFNISQLIYPDRIDITNLTNGKAYNNFINGEIVTSGGTRFGRNFITYNKRLQLERCLCKVNYMNIGDNLIVDGHVNLTNDDYGNYLQLNTTTNPTIKLNQYYGSKGLNELFINCRETKSWTLVDNYDTTITSHDGLTEAGVKHFVCYDLNGTDTWIQI